MFYLLNAIFIYIRSLFWVYLCIDCNTSWCISLSHDILFNIVLYIHLLANDARMWGASRPPPEGLSTKNRQKPQATPLTGTTSSVQQTVRLTAVRLKHFSSLGSHTECAMNKLLSVRAQTESAVSTLFSLILLRRSLFSASVSMVTAGIQQCRSRGFIYSNLQTVRSSYEQG